ncbi:MAG: hypothetical protein QM773_13780 [Hyphomonadaceae bacterium]
MGAQITIVDLGIFFLLAMMVIGQAAKWANDGGEQSDFGAYTISFIIILIGWILLTALVLAALGAALWGGLWAWNTFVP